MDLDNDLISIFNFVSTQMKDSFEYKSIESQGGLPIHHKKKGKNAKCIVYPIGLATILTSKEIPAHNNSTKQKFKLDGSIYIDAYYNGFIEGKQYFIDKFKNNPFQSKETIVIDLHRYYYHQPTEKGNGVGWKDFVGTSTPTLLSNKNIETWGFYNGIIYELREFIKLNAELCKDIDKCNSYNEHDDINNFPFYCKIGALFAQGFISKKTLKGIGSEYFYKEEKFNTPNQLSIYIKNEVLKTEKQVKQYINGTLKENAEKNFYNNKRLMKNTIEYCNENNIKITPEFLSKYNSLDN